MGARYEVWITNDRGDRILQTDKFFFMNYARIVNSIDYISISFPLDFIRAELGATVFEPDWRAEVWRAPDDDFDLRLERAFFLRRPNFYIRQSDTMNIVEYSGRGPNSLLEGRVIVRNRPPNSEDYYNPIDDRVDNVMKKIVRETMGDEAPDNSGSLDPARDLTATGFFEIEADTGLGPEYVGQFLGKQVLETLKRLSGFSEQKWAINQSNRRIFFDVVNATRTIFRFQTFADQRGSDIRESGLVFSPENENLKAPLLKLDHFDERNVVYAAGQGEGLNRTIVERRDDNRINASIWNRKEQWRDARNTPDSQLDDLALAELDAGRPKNEFFATFLNSPGGPGLPRSLYGVDWDIGDLVRVNYAGFQIDTEIRVVYVAVNEFGEESISGKVTISG